MKNYLTTLGTALMAVAVFFTGGIVFAAPVQADTQVPVGIYSSHQDDEDEDNDDDRFTRYRYSSSLTRKIRALDDDEVENLPIPVLMGVSLKQILPNFGDPRGGGTRTHEGLDIMAPRGAIVASPTEAVVIRTGEGDSSGIYVTTANPGGETMNFYHLDAIADGVRSGTVLEEGDVIGYVGNTGNASGGAPHLHWEIRESRRAEDPFPRLTHEFSSEIRVRVLTEILKELQAELKRLLD